MRERLEDVIAFLNKFTERYSDYSTILDPANKVNGQYQEYVDICFGTAAALFELLTDCKKRLFQTTLDEIIQERYLYDDAYLIEGSLRSNSQSHSWIMIPFQGKVILIQSLGAIYGAFYTLWEPEKLIEQLKGLPQVKTREIFEFVDDKIDVNQLKITYQACPRFTLNPRRLPDLSQYRHVLDPLRKKYFQQRQLTAANNGTLTPYGVYQKNGVLYIDGVGSLYRMPDAFKRVWAMQYM